MSAKHKSSKKKPSKKPPTKKQSLTKHRILSLVIYGVIIFLCFTTLSFGAYTIGIKHQQQVNQARLDRIKDIYKSLKLDDSYRIESANVFGDKREYDWDSSRTYSSSVIYYRDASRGATFDDLNKKVEAAGFKQIEGPNYGDVARQDHYKSANGEYIRISIDSAAFRDAIRTQTHGDVAKLRSDGLLDKAPVFATIKVNLDDNNE